MAYNGTSMDVFRDQIANMTKTELEELYRSDDKIKLMIRESSYIRDMKSKKKQLTESNRKLANENLKFEPELAKVKVDLIAAHQNFTKALDSYNSYKNKLDEIRGDFSMEKISALMKVANSQENDMAECLLHELISGEINLDKFVPKMLKLRESYQKRRIKIEKLTELENQTSGGNNHGGHPSL